MSRIFLIAAWVWVGLVSTPAVAQLGPKGSATDINLVKVGQSAPDFTLESSDGEAITLADYRGKKSVVLVFYRGRW